MQDPTEEERYWRKHHDKQPYADKNLSYEHYAPAYRTGYAAAVRHAGKAFEEIEHELTLDYEKIRTGDDPAWDFARPAVKAAWDRLGGVLSPQDPDRGIRSGM